MIEALFLNIQATAVGSRKNNFYSPYEHKTYKYRRKMNTKIMNTKIMNTKIINTKIY
jgi:hypothetical protein